MKKRFLVKGETHLGVMLTLRRFKTREAAENHPVMMKYWKRVWIEEDTSPDDAPVTHAPPLPWVMEWPNGGCFTYIRDAEDRRILTLFGTIKRREHMERMLREAGLVQ